MRLPLALLACAACAGLALPALAGRPFATEDAGALDAGECELEAVLAHETARGEASARSLALQPGCGVGGGLQLGLGVARSRAGEARSTGVALAAKWAFVDGGEAATSWALAFGGGALREGGRWAHDGRGASLVASRPAGGGTWHANLGHARGGGRSATTWALAHERPWLEGVDLGAELYGDDRGAPWAGLGVRWSLGAAVAVDAAFGRQLDGGRARAASLGLVLGF
jgi:hypothetical protein